jgi:hypothetical protein
MRMTAKRPYTQEVMTERKELLICPRCKEPWGRIFLVNKRVYVNPIGSKVMMRVGTHQCVCGRKFHFQGEELDDRYATSPAPPPRA